jgi:hypothetical protein
MRTDRVARRVPWYPTSREKRARCGAPDLLLPGQDSKGGKNRLAMERKHLKNPFSAHVRWGEHGAPVQGRGLRSPPDDKGESGLSRGSVAAGCAGPLSSWPKPQLLQQVLETRVGAAAVEYGVDSQDAHFAISVSLGAIKPAYGVIAIAQGAVDDG